MSFCFNSIINEKKITIIRHKYIDDLEKFNIFKLVINHIKNAFIKSPKGLLNI